MKYHDDEVYTNSLVVETRQEKWKSNRFGIGVAEISLSWEYRWTQHFGILNFLKTYFYFMVICNFIYLCMNVYIMPVCVYVYAAWTHMDPGHGVKWSQIAYD